ncbi:disintegrin and metalloproteinase domain-containing protein 10-like [Amblyomma americanum]
MASLAHTALVLNDFLQHYEPLSYVPVHVVRGRWKRSTAERRSMRNVQLAFGAHNRELRLRLRQDRSAFSDDFILQVQTGSVSPSLDHLYSGCVMGAPGSRVVGSIITGVFSGNISLSREEEEFYVERAGRFFPDSVPFHSLIYSARDVSFAGGRCGLYGATKDALDRIRHRYRRQQLTILQAVIANPQKQQRLKRSARHIDLEMATRAGTVQRTATTHDLKIQAGNIRASAPRRSRVLSASKKSRKTYVQGAAKRGSSGLTSMVSKHANAISDMFGSRNYNGITDIRFEVLRRVRCWYLTLAAVILYGAAAVVFLHACAVHTPSSNPHMVPKMRLGQSARHTVSFLKGMTRL